MKYRQGTVRRLWWICSRSGVFGPCKGDNKGQMPRHEQFGITSTHCITVQNVTSEGITSSIEVTHHFAKLVWSSREYGSGSSGQERIKTFIKDVLLPLNPG